MSEMSTANTTKLCIACSKWVPEDLKSCDCGHVFKQQKSTNGKRIREGRFYYEDVEEEDYEPKKKHKSSTNSNLKEKITTHMPYSYDGDYEIEKKEKRRRKKRSLNLINETMRYHNSIQSVKPQKINLTTKEIDLIVDGQPLIQVLQEINNKITNQKRLWINLDA